MSHGLSCHAFLHLHMRSVMSSSCRTAYYHTLARLLFMEDTPSRFKTFMLPLQQVGWGRLGRWAGRGWGRYVWHRV